MQNDQISQKYLGLAPADMARLPHLINPKNSIFTSKQPSAGTTPTLNFALLYKGKRPFLTRYSPSSS
jgi:hypothetical protein